MADTANALDQLLEQLTKRLTAPPSAPDAIDAALAAPPRVREVHSLRNDPKVQAFRDELVNGLIRADTAHQLISLLSSIVDKLPMPGITGIPGLP